MKAEELRIGNYVLDEDREISKIEQISSDNIHKFTLVSGDAINIYPSNIYPIPLTEEILLKCGIVNGEIEIKGRVVEIYQHFGDDKIWFFNIEHNLTVEINYLHQLQNIFYCLTGEELTINL